MASKTVERAEPESGGDVATALKDIPPLTTAPALTSSDRVAALRLVADSVAQQRQIAAQSIIFHPVSLAVLAACLGVVWQFLYKDRSDLPLIGTTWAGCVMAGLVIVRAVTGDYLALAEKTGTWVWLYGEKREDENERKDEEEDVVLITKFGEEVIGAVVLRAAASANSESLSSSSSSTSTSSNKSPSLRNRNNTSEKTKSSNASKTRSAQPVGAIRAWTVKQRYRRKGVGTGLLEEAVSVCREKRWNGPVFDDNHANSAQLLPRMFNARFERTEKWARGLLEDVIHSIEQQGRREKKR